ncbi:unnamed protein product [Adineta ricciae]|uniref:SHSP domain-containing protein n=1 Tax=Adineta ricciae TaxID=249248 RepID=A0A814QGG7_ADIRI|nr:unnamed protein product [Adineta ricciae]CAF1120289.1 unnamed protein product [Adineta ricciae]
MTCTQTCCHYFFDDFDFCDTWDCFDLCSSTYCTHPKMRQGICKPQASKNARNTKNSPQSTPQAQNSLSYSNNNRNNAKSDKFSVQLDVTGYNRDLIKPKVEGGKIVVEAKQEDQLPDGDYNIRQLRRSYELPQQADPSRMTSNISPNNMLTIEVPYRNSGSGGQPTKGNGGQSTKGNLTQSYGPASSPAEYLNFLKSGEFSPNVIDKDNNQKVLELTFDVKDCPAEELKVSVKDNLLTVEGEHMDTENNHSKRTRFARTTTLPIGAQLEQMKSNLNNEGQLKVEIPFVLN